MNDERIKKIYELKKQKDALDEQLNKLKEKIDSISKTIDEETPNVLTDILSEGLSSYKHPTEDIVVTLCHNTSTDYKDEKSVLDYLLENYPELVKTTHKIDKKGTNKEIKTNMSLKESLNNFLETKTTQYVVITSSENTEKMLQHMVEDK